MKFVLNFHLESHSRSFCRHLSFFATLLEFKHVSYASYSYVFQLECCPVNRILDIKLESHRANYFFHTPPSVSENHTYFSGSCYCTPLWPRPGPFLTLCSTTSPPVITMAIIATSLRELCTRAGLAAAIYVPVPALDSVSLDPALCRSPGYTLSVA